MAAKDVSKDWYAPNQQAVGQPGPARATSDGKGTVARSTEAPDVEDDDGEPKKVAAKTTKATKKS